MSVIDVIKSSLDSLHQISEHIDGALVYIDAGCTESFQFLGAFPLLLEHGARAVCSLESMSTLDKVVDWNASLVSARKILVMTSCLLSDAHRYILRCLSTHEDIRSCTILTSISEVAHSAYPDSPLGPDAFCEYESLLIQDYEEVLNKRLTKFGQLKERIVQETLNLEDEAGSQHEEKDASPGSQTSYKDNFVEREDAKLKLSVSVHHFPMIFCPLSPKVFVLPSEGSVAEAYLSVENADSLSPGLPSLSTGVALDSDDVVPGAIFTAHFLYHLASEMDLKLEIFSFGDLSRTVGRVMTDMSSLYDVGRRKRSAGLLLIDRTLDLLTPCCHGDSFFDRIFSALPRRERLASSFSTKSSQTPLIHGRGIIQHAPLDAQIALDDILCREDSRPDNFPLLESVEAILCGWNSSSSTAMIQDLINLSAKVSEQKSSTSNELLCGSFISAETFRGTPYLDALLDLRMRDGAVLVKKWLQEILRRENVSLKVKPRGGSATKSDLEPMVKALVRSDACVLRNKGIIQLAVAALNCLDEMHCAKWDAFASAEKMLGVCAGDSSQNLAAQIEDLLNKSILARTQLHEGKLDSSGGLLLFKDALLLAIIGYILAGENFPTSSSGSPFSWQEEHLLKEAIVDAVLENPAASKLKFVHDLAEQLESYRNEIISNKTKEEPTVSIDDFDDDQWGKWADEEDDDDNKQERGYNDMQLKLEVRDRVESLFRFFHKLSSIKTKNSQLREGSFGMEAGSIMDSYETKGLLYKLLTRVFGKHDVPGLEHHSSAVGRLFKSGFGRFGLGQAKPSLADQNAILVFVIGGINGLEVREGMEALSESGRPDIELILGGTTLLNPDNMLDLLLGNASYF